MNKELVHEGMRTNCQTEQDTVRNEGRDGEGRRHGNTLRRRNSARMFKGADAAGGSEEQRVEGRRKVCVVFPLACLPADVKRK